MSLRQIAKELGVSHTLLVLWRQGKRTLKPELEDRFDYLMARGGYKSGYKTAASQFPREATQRTSESPVTANYSWREREGVEPTAPTEGPGPTDLKSAKPTRTHPLPWQEPADLPAPATNPHGSGFRHSRECLKPDRCCQYSEAYARQIGLRPLGYGLFQSALEDGLRYGTNYLVDRLTSVEDQ